MCFEVCRSDPKISGPVKQSSPRERSNRNKKALYCDSPYSFGKGWQWTCVSSITGSLSSKAVYGGGVIRKGQPGLLVGDRHTAGG